jgi:hypothetical protein
MQGATGGSASNTGAGTIPDRTGGGDERGVGAGAVLDTPEATAADDDPPVVEAPVPTLIGDVSFSTPSQTFEGQLEVTMAADNPRAEIRFATDGELPTAASALYDGTPLVLTETTQLRAQAFEGGAPLGSPSTAIFIRRTFDVSSDIPLVIMEGYGAGKPPVDDKENFMDLAFMLFEPAGGTSAISALPTVATRAGYHIRGQSSANFEKAPYRLELWDNADEDADYPIAGMAAEADWAMIGPYSDKTLVRNAFVYSLAADMGLVAMQLRFAEVYINQDSGPLEPEDYQGVYAITQTVKNQKSRVDLKQLRVEDTSPADLSGGYIFKFDQAAIDEGETELLCTGAPPIQGGFGQQGGGGGTCWDDLELVDPSPANPEQVAWITSHLQEFHDVLHTEPLDQAYLDYIDLPSFVDHFIIAEITRNVDAFIRSHFMHKDRNERIKAGPVWDYNFSLNNFGDDIEGFQWQSGRRGSNDWFDILPENEPFMAAVMERWRELRETLLSDEAIRARVDAVSAPLVTAGPRDLERWPVGETNIGFGGGGDPDAPTTWEGQREQLASWTIERINWLDGEWL